MLRLRLYRDQLKLRIESERNFTSLQRISVTENKPENLPRILKESDEILYKAKSEGKDRIYVRESAPMM